MYFSIFQEKKDYHIYCTHLCALSQQLGDTAPFRLPVLGDNYSLMMLSVSRKLLYYHVLRLQSRPINKTHETSKYCIWNTFLWHLNKLQPRWQLNYFLTVYIAFPQVMDRFEMWWMDEKQLMKWVTGFGGPLNQPRIFTSSSILSSNVP